MDLGYKNLVDANAVLAIVNVRSKPNKRLLSNARLENKVINLTKGKAAKCFVIMDNWDIYVVSKNPRTIRVTYFDSVTELNKKNKSELVEPMIELGFDNYVFPNKINSVLTIDMTSNKKMLKEKKEASLVLDCTHGKKIRSIITLKNSYIIISAFESLAIEKRRTKNINLMICAKNDLEINEDDLKQEDIDIENEYESEEGNEEIEIE